MDIIVTWDADERDDLPQTVTVPASVVDEYTEASAHLHDDESWEIITDWLSDSFGFCVIAWDRA